MVDTDRKKKNCQLVFREHVRYTAVYAMRRRRRAVLHVPSLQPLRRIPRYHQHRENDHQSRETANRPCRVQENIHSVHAPLPPPSLCTYALRGLKTSVSLPPCLRLTRAPGVCGSSASALPRAREKGVATAVTARMGGGPARGEKNARARRTGRARRAASTRVGGRAARSPPRSLPRDGEVAQGWGVGRGAGDESFFLPRRLYTKYQLIWLNWIPPRSCRATPACGRLWKLVANHGRPAKSVALGPVRQFGFFRVGWVEKFLSAAVW